MTKVLWNADERRLRAGWRIVLQILLAVGLVWIAGKLTLPLVGPRLAQLVAPLVGITAAVWVAGRWIDRRTFADFGLRIGGAWWADFGMGLALGLSLIAMVVAVMAATGWLAIDAAIEPDAAAAFLSSLLYAIVLYAGVGFYEELLFRGYLMTNLAEGLSGRRIPPRIGVVIAWSAAAVLFGIGHVFNPNVTLLSTVNVVMGGLFVGLGFLLTGELALPIGLHTAWNFAQGAVFGLPISGTSIDHARFLVAREMGPDGWTGGAFGLEGGLLGLGAMGVGSVATLVWIRVHRGRTAVATSIGVYKG